MHTNMFCFGMWGLQIHHKILRKQGGQVYKVVHRWTAECYVDFYCDVLMTSNCWRILCTPKVSLEYLIVPTNYVSSEWGRKLEYPDRSPLCSCFCIRTWIKLISKSHSVGTWWEECVWGHFDIGCFGVWTYISGTCSCSNGYRSIHKQCLMLNVTTVGSLYVCFWGEALCCFSLQGGSRSSE